MTDEPRSRGSAGALALGHRSSHVDMPERDPVHRAAQEVVRALIDSRWSLQAAVVVVALRELCETVTGTRVDAWPRDRSYWNAHSQVAPCSEP